MNRRGHALLVLRPLVLAAIASAPLALSLGPGVGWAGPKGWIAPRYPRALKLQVREQGSGGYRYDYAQWSGSFDQPKSDLVAADFAWRSRFKQLSYTRYGKNGAISAASRVGSSTAAGSWSWMGAGFGRAGGYENCNHSGTITGTLKGLTSLSGGMEGILTRKGLRLLVDPGAFTVSDPGDPNARCFLGHGETLNKLFGFSGLSLSCSQELFDFCPAGATAASVFIPAKKLSAHRRTEVEVASTEEPSLTLASDCAMGFPDEICTQSFGWKAVLTITRHTGKAPR